MSQGHPPEQGCTHGLHPPELSCTHDGELRFTLARYFAFYIAMLHPSVLGLVNYIDTKVKCLHLKNLPVKVRHFAAGVNLSEAPLPSQVFVWSGLAIL